MDKGSHFLHIEQHPTPVRRALKDVARVEVLGISDIGERDELIARWVGELRESRAEDANKKYRKLSTYSAQRVLRFWQAREKMAAAS